MNAWRCLLIGIVLGGLAGCVYRPSHYESVFSRYYATTVGQTTASDVLAYLKHDDELLSQSESVVASFGTLDKGRTHWFNLVAFPQDGSTVARKYAFSCDETVRLPNGAPRPAVRFDAHLIIDDKVLAENYPSANAKRIAVLRFVRDQLNKDGLEISYESAALRGSLALANQLLNAALNELANTPAKAALLPELKGMEFDHMSLGKSHIRMLIDDNTVKVKIKSGKFWQSTPFEKQPDVIHM